MEKFDPVEYVRGLQQLLVSDKKRIGFLFGAGTSLARKSNDSITVPAIGQMTNLVVEELSKKSNFESAIIEIKNEISADKFNIESFLSNIESKKNIIGSGSLNGLDKNGFDELIEATKKEIIRIVSVHKQIIEQNRIDDLIHVDFAEWIGRADRKYPVEIFTTNYDYLFEIGLEDKTIPYYDGFTGSFNPFFNSDSIENMKFLPNQAKLWKIHGSLGWKLEDKKVLRKDSSHEDILIYPSVLKYDNSRKLPYISLMDRLSNFLKQPDTILIVSGYSFGDDHINERILTALNTHANSHVFVFYFDKYWENDEKKYSLTADCSIVKLAKENSKLSIFGCRNAVIGSRYGVWKLKREPDSEDTINVSIYFDEDGPLDENDELNVEKLGNEHWTGEGEFKLVDFVSFTNFLKSMIGNFGGDTVEW